MDWPPNYAAEFKRRLLFLERLSTDTHLRAEIMAHYKNNPVDWINDWCVTYDPRKKSPDPKLMPFSLFPRQVDYIHYLRGCLEDNESGLVEKARDMGASWLSCAFSIWLWLFYEGTAIGWGSRKEEYVDKKGDPKAIFPKMRQILENLPPWMLPDKYDAREHATYMRIINPANGSTITGEAGDNIGRGGRTTMYFKDESAHYERPELIEAALGDNTDVQIDISSVNGSANVFYRRRMAGVEWLPNAVPPAGKVRVFIFDWSDHPDKDQEWYNRRRAKAESEGMLHVFKQEVERDYSGSQDRIIIPQEWVKAAIDAHIKLGFTPSGTAIAGQDVADGGGDKNALVIREGVLCKYANHWAGEAGDAAEIAIPVCGQYGVRELYYDSIGVGAGFKVGANHLKDRPATWPNGLMIFPWNAGATPLDPDEPSIQGDNQSPTNKNQYANLKAQAWFRMRTRFYKTYAAIHKGKSYPPEELVSLSSDMENLHQLCLELSQAVQKKNGEGKATVDKKPEGAVSPNMADAFVMAYNPVKQVSILDVI